MSALRVLITGRNGFTGSHLASEFHTAGYDVVGTGLSSATRAGPGAYIACDLRDGAAVAELIAQTRPDIVVHLAGMAFVAHGNVEDIYTANLFASRNLLAALKQHGCGQSGVLLASSGTVYGNVAIPSLSEDVSAMPANDYGVSKLAMEHMSRLFSDVLPIIITRPFNYTGQGQDPKFLVPKIVAHFRVQAPHIELGNIDVARDFSDVRDVVRIYRALIEARAWGETVNVCSGVATSLEEVLQLCAKRTGHDIETRVNPDFVRADEIKILKGDPGHLHALIGEMPRKPLSDTLDWMLSAP